MGPGERKRDRSPPFWLASACDRGRNSIALLAAVKHTQQNQSLSVPAIAKGISCVQRLEQDFTILRAACDGAAKLRVRGDDLSLRHDLSGNDPSQGRVPFLQKFSEASRSANAAVDHSSFTSCAMA
jgi:hypothetical protein